MTDRLKERLGNRLEREASRRNSAYDHFGMDNTPQSVDPDVFEALAYITQLEAEVERLTKAGQAVLDSWDANSFEREKYVEPRDGDIPGYWSPHAAMVNSEYIAALRAALHQGDRKP